MTMPPADRTGGTIEGNDFDLTTRVKSRTFGGSTVLTRSTPLPDPPPCRGDRWYCGRLGLLDRWLAGAQNQCCVDFDDDDSVVPITDGGDHG